MSKFGQLIMTGIKGLSLTEEESKFISEENIGGVLLFKENFESAAQLAELVNSIQQLRNEYPLFIATDHEGGRVQRFKKGFTHFPPMLDLAKLDSPKIVFEAAEIMAKELHACGVNLALAPVCDIFNNPDNKVIADRAFGHDRESVSKFSSSIIRGLQTNQVLSCAKHFPGHGNTLKDSHFDLPLVKKSIEDLRNEEFVPFSKAIKSRVEFVMMAHLLVDSIDEKLPCSLSKKAHDILRNELRYKNLIISDDMQMKAIQDNYPVGEAAVLAINAGTDIVEYRDMDQAKLALEGLKQAYSMKNLSSEVVADRYNRIMASKEKNIKEYKPIYIPDLSKVVGAISHSEFLLNIQDELAEK